MIAQSTILLFTIIIIAPFGIALAPAAKYFFIIYVIITNVALILLY